MSENILTILGYIAGVILVFLLIRELVTWYWKINRIVESLDRIDSNLQYIASILEKKNPGIVDEIEISEKDEQT